MMVCIACGDAKELDESRCSPGVRAYKQCARCGTVGMRDDQDKYQERHAKKANTAPYENSPYRGGKMAAKGGAK